MESLSNIYWNQFIKEYVPSLNVRKKWNKVKRNVKVNDIVLLYDTNTPRSFWLLARVIKANLSEDEPEWSATLKLSNTTLVRPENKLCLFEVSTWICLNEFSLGVEECCVYWHCKRRQNRNANLSAVSPSAVILFPLPVFICIFPRFCQSSFEKWQRRSCLVAKRSLVKFSSKTFVCAASSKFKVLKCLKLVVTSVFIVVLLVLLLGKG